MRKFFLLILCLVSFMRNASVSYAQTVITSSQVVESILGVEAHRNELTRLNSGITTLLADARLTDLEVRQILQESQNVLGEMLNQKIGSNAGKLVDLAKWLRVQGDEKQSIRSKVENPTSQQQFVLDNPLAGEEIYLTSLLSGILGTYLEMDKEAAGSAKLESLLQLYLSFRPVMERGWRLMDNFILFAPQWTKARFLQLNADQKRQFLKDINDAREEKAAGVAADEESIPLPTPEEQAAYDTAYQFVVSNTPPL